MKRMYELETEDVKDAVKYWISTKYNPGKYLDVQIECVRSVEGYGEEQHEIYYPKVTVVENDHPVTETE